MQWVSANYKEVQLLKTTLGTDFNVVLIEGLIYIETGCAGL